MKFKALIDGVHYDPKKGAVKIVLIATSHASLDELTTLSPKKDEPIKVTLESEQTKIGVIPNHGTIELEERDVGLPIRLNGEKAGVKLKEVAERLREGAEEEKDVEPEEGRIITEFPTPEADPGDIPDDEGDEEDGGGQGEII